MIRLALTLGSIVSTVATPVVAQVHHAPTKRTLSALEKQRAKEKLIEHLRSSAYYNNDQSIRDIVYSMPESYFDNLYSISKYGSDREFNLASGDVMRQYAGAVYSHQEGQSLSDFDKSVLSMLVSSYSTQLKADSLERLAQELERAGRFDEAVRMRQMAREYEYRLTDWSRRIALAAQAGNHINLSNLESEFLRHKGDLDSHFWHGSEFGKYYDALEHIQNHLDNFNFDGGRIPNLDNLIGAAKLASALHLENMKDYQKIIMWVSGAFSLILSVWIFMLFIRKRKSKVSRSLKTLLVSLSIIMFLVGAAFGVMPFLGGM